MHNENAQNSWDNIQMDCRALMSGAVHGKYAAACTGCGAAAGNGDGAE